MQAIEVRKDGVIYCTYADESALPDKDTIKIMKAAGYKLYQDGKLYKQETKQYKIN